jgi:hypothetical protein
MNELAFEARDAGLPPRSCAADAAVPFVRETTIDAGGEALWRGVDWHRAPLRQPVHVPRPWTQTLADAYV